MTMFVNAALFTTFFLHLTNGIDNAILEPSYTMDAGVWYPWGECYAGTYAYAFQVKADQEAKHFRDNMGMTGVKIFCQNQENLNDNVPAIKELKTGSWRSKQTCPSGQWLTGFRLRVQKYQGLVVDDTAANDLQMICDYKTSYTGEGTNAGSWLDWANCTKGEVICGVKPKVETKLFTDHVGLVSLHMKCCALHPKPTRASSSSNDSFSLNEIKKETNVNSHSFKNTIKPFEETLKTTSVGSIKAKEVPAESYGVTLVDAYTHKPTPRKDVVFPQSEVSSSIERQSSAEADIADKKKLSAQVPDPLDKTDEPIHFSKRQPFEGIRTKSLFNLFKYYRSLFHF